MGRSGALVGLFLSIGVVLGVGLAVGAPQPAGLQRIEWLENPRGLRDFSLATGSGQLDNQALRGRWSIVLFGFLNCPDVCPTSLAQLATLADRLAQPVGDQARYLFVSVDPRRDSPQQVAEYVAHFHPSIAGVTGTDQQLTRFATDLGVRFKVTADPNDYRVAHSITYSIIDPRGVFRGRFRPGFDPTTLAGQLADRLVGDER